MHIKHLAQHLIPRMHSQHSYMLSNIIPGTHWELQKRYIVSIIINP